MADHDLLRRIEELIHKMTALEAQTEDAGASEDIITTMKCLIALADAVLQERPVFGIEPWHAITEEAPLEAPGEMLLRLKDAQGRALPPYPAIMTFYRNNLTAEIDTILVLCALRQFKESEERHASFNISLRSLRDTDFVKTVLERIGTLGLEPGRSLIAEIHESTPNLKMSRKVLDAFREAGVAFAIDDVGLSMNDVFRLSEFEDMADFIKLDRQSVRSHPENPNSLDHVVSLIHSMLPGAALVAEGVKSAEHARQVHAFHPAICYVQGLHLPERDEFARQWREAAAA